MITNVVANISDIEGVPAEEMTPDMRLGGTPVAQEEPETITTSAGGYNAGDRVTITDSSFRGLIGVTGVIEGFRGDDMLIKVNDEIYLFSMSNITRA